ncbi:MAG: hypothetical protein R6W82_01500 [bacterium]
MKAAGGGCHGPSSGDDDWKRPWRMVGYVALLALLFLSALSFLGLVPESRGAVQDPAGVEEVAPDRAWEQVKDSTSFEEDLPDPLVLRAVGSSTHFRGYLGEELLVHGHGDAAPDGGAGLRIEGTGTLRLRALRIVPIRE